MKSDASTTPSDVLAFWREAGPKRWFKKNEAFDDAFRARFLSAYEAAAASRLVRWGDDAQGALALLLLLDQFPRNAFRGDPRTYATDAQARDVADAAIAAGFDLVVEPLLRPFFYMPFMHSETLADLERCIALCAPLDDDTQRFALMHRDILQRFGRYPHRNAVLGRESTHEEERYLAEGGFKG